MSRRRSPWRLKSDADVPSDIPGMGSRRSGWMLWLLIGAPDPEPTCAALRRSR
jgi:hypothetical protein